jgi:hypothetical protein
LFLRLEIVKKGIIVVVVAATWQWGITAMIYGQLAVAVICFFLNAFYSGRLLGYAAMAQIRDMAPYAGAALGMGCVLRVIESVGWSSDFALLLTQIGSGAVVFLAICRLFSLAAFMDLWRRWPLVVGFAGESL